MSKITTWLGEITFGDGCVFAISGNERIAHPFDSMHEAVEWMCDSPIPISELEKVRLPPSHTKWIDGCSCVLRASDGAEYYQWMKVHPLSAGAIVTTEFRGFTYVIAKCTSVGLARDFVHAAHMRVVIEV